MFSDGHGVTNCIFSLGPPYFLTVLSERTLKASLVLNKMTPFLCPKITVRSGWRSTEKQHLVMEFLYWSLEVSEAERCLPGGKCQMYLSLSFLIFAFFFSKQNLTLCFAGINWLFPCLALGMKTDTSMTYPALQKQLFHTKRFH